MSTTKVAEIESPRGPFPVFEAIDTVPFPTVWWHTPNGMYGVGPVEGSPTPESRQAAIEEIAAQIAVDDLDV